jgi:hypothetical protein
MNPSQSSRGRSLRPNVSENRSAARQRKYSAIGMKGYPGLTRTGGLWSLEVQIDDNRILSVSHDYSLADLTWAGIDLLMWNIRRNINKIARAGLLAEFQLISPSHSNSAFDDVENRLQFPMVVRSGLGIRLNHHGAGPQLVCSGSGMGDGGTTRHARSLWCIQVKFVRMYDFDSMLGPIHGKPRVELCILVAASTFRHFRGTAPAGGLGWLIDYRCGVAGKVPGELRPDIIADQTELPCAS